jgi:hypothetical protein
MDQKETQQKLDNITQTLKQLIEQTQVKASLLKLETQDAWQDVEKGFFRIKSYFEKDWQQTKQDLGEAQVQAHLGMMEAKEQWNELKEDLGQAIQKLKAQESFDRARLQAHLAKMEASDLYAEKRKEWSDEYETKVKPQIKRSMEEMQKEMETMAKSLID